MNAALSTAIDRFTRAHGDARGIARTRIPGMTLLRATDTADVRHSIERPLICLVAQGAKHVTMSDRAFTVEAGGSMIVSSNQPALTRIVKAKRSEPYLSFSLRLDAAIISDCLAELNKAPGRENTAPPRDTQDEVADVARRMICLHDHPASLDPLRASLTREMHHWLLVGHHGEEITRLGYPDSHSARIGRAVEFIRTEFSAPISIEQLASIAGMSASTFHHHFRAQTSLSPIQFQKRLRLIHARQLMLSKGQTSSAAAFQVGYASVQQFTRDYRRLFGLPPIREIEAARRLPSHA